MKNSTRPGGAPGGRHPQLSNGSESGKVELLKEPCQVEDLMRQAEEQRPVPGRHSRRHPHRPPPPDHLLRRPGQYCPGPHQSAQQRH